MRNRYGYPGGAYFYDYGGVPYYAYSYSYDISARNSRQSVFAQDAWHARNRLTINAGVRGDMHPGWRQERRQRLLEHQLGAPHRRGS